MGKGMRTAIVVEVVVLLVALAFSILFFRYGLYRTSQVPLVMLIVLWVLVAAVLLFVLWSRSLKREEMLRRFYLNKDWIYNPEIGYAPISRVAPEADEFELVTFAADSLAQMSYGFEVADPPEDFIPEYLITSSRFRFRKSTLGEGDSTEDQYAIVDDWVGTLQHVDSVSESGEEQCTEVGQFRDARELALLLSDNGALG